LRLELPVRQDRSPARICERCFAMELSAFSRIFCL